MRNWTSTKKHSGLASLVSRVSVATRLENTDLESHYEYAVIEREIALKHPQNQPKIAFASKLS